MDFQKCERRFYFAQILNLKPHTYPLPMEKGIFGHRCFEYAFKAMQQGLSYEECVAAIDPLLMANVDNIEYLKVYRHVIAFLAKAFQAEWVVVSVEENLLAPLNNGEAGQIEFAFTPDIVFQFTLGPHRGQYFMLDFKFVAQYWNDRQLAMLQQLPKYSINWKKLHPDMPIRQLGVAMMNTRASQTATGDQLFMIKWLPITKQGMQRIDFENTKMMQRVAWAKTNFRPDDYLRTVDSNQCKTCFFADDLCPADLNGRDTTKIIARDYEQNTYFADNYEREISGREDARAIEPSSSEEAN